MCLWTAVGALALIMASAAVGASHGVLVGIAGAGFFVEMIEIRMLLLAQSNRVR
jgi:hypothetical protein